MDYLWDASGGVMLCAQYALQRVQEMVRTNSMDSSQPGRHAAGRRARERAGRKKTRKKGETRIKTEARRAERRGRVNCSLQQLKALSCGHSRWMRGNMRRVTSLCPSAPALSACLDPLPLC